MSARRVRERGEDGAVAVLVALLAVVLFVCAALAVDITQKSLTRQTLHDTLDTAAHAGAYALPGDGVGAKAAALAMAKANDPSVVPQVDLWCVVASTGALKTVKASQIPTTCNPGAAPYDVAHYPGLRCNTKLCAIPCVAEEGDVCNTVRAADSKVVPFDFAPIVGIKQGNTGAVSSVACKGSCGTESPNPLDVVIVADRTPSMADDDRDAMVDGIESVLLKMDPTQQYVALATIHKSKNNASCVTEDTPSSEGASGGKWIPVPFSNNYVTGTTTKTLNTASTMVQGLNCMPASKQGAFGTHLAGAIKGAARYLLNMDSNNLSSLPARVGTPRKVIIFETDGQPDETLNGGSTNLTTSGDIGTGRNFYGNGNGEKGCDNFIDVANQVKAAGILVISIGFGDANSAPCERAITSSGQDRTPRAPWVRNYLSAAASVDADGDASDADNTCSTTAQRTTENGDGDYYYCAATGAELGPIFASAISSVSSSIRLIQMP
jgi:hypothetical protein